MAYTRANSPWSPQEDKDLVEVWENHSKTKGTIIWLADKHHRSVGAITSRLSKIGYILPVYWDDSRIDNPYTQADVTNLIEERKMNDWLSNQNKSASHVQELLTEDYYTVEVSFNQQFESKTLDRLYTYKVDNSLVVSEGDFVVVKARGEFKVCKVIKKHASAEIDFSANFEYQYIVNVVDNALYDSLQERGKKIEQAVVAMHKNSLKRDLLNEFASNYSTDDIKKLEAEIGSKLLDK